MDTAECLCGEPIQFIERLMVDCRLFVDLRELHDFDVRVNGGNKLLTKYEFGFALNHRTNSSLQ